MSCKPDNWSLKELSDALNNKHKDGRRIVVPMFQRGARWSRKQDEGLIDSLRKGFPIGTMLFYSVIENNTQTYILVDGLQRSNCIRKYITRPTEYFEDSLIDDKACSHLLGIMGLKPVDENMGLVKDSIRKFVAAQQSYSNLDCYKLAHTLINLFGLAKTDHVLEMAASANDAIKKMFEPFQGQYDDIAKIEVPVVVYSGDQANLTEIFKRINSQGTVLNQYEVYSAAWPSNKKFFIENAEIVGAVLKKYESMAKDGIEVYKYDHNEIYKKKELAPFEYLFGLGKYLTQTFDILRFQTGLRDDEVNPLGFELVDACLNDSNHVYELYKKILEIKDVNQFEKALMSAIDFVDQTVSAITQFKGNNHTAKKIFHSKFQIMSMIATTFKKMYADGEYAEPRLEWKQDKENLEKNLLQYYVYDILENYWGEGGTRKIYKVKVEDRYVTPPSGNMWNAVLNKYFESSLQKNESKNIHNPGNEEFVFLTCVYLQTFTAIDQLSAKKFDIEHLAPKAQLKGLIKACNGSGLPIGSIANLCYLPEFDNRMKKDKTIYQDEKYKQCVDISDVEKKFSFTTKEDLEWLDKPFDDEEDFLDLKKYYETFLRNRFAILKKKFCESMGIDLDESGTDGQDLPQSGASALGKKKHSEIIETAMMRYQELVPDVGFKKVSDCWGVDSQGRHYFFSQSKAYERKDGKMYWYAYRPEVFDEDKVKDGKEIRLCFVFADDNRVVIVPQKFVCDNLDQLPKSPHEDGSAHWHIKIKAFNADGKVKMMVGKQKDHQFVELEDVV